MILSCSWIYLPCLSSSVIIRFFPRRCVLLTFFMLLDAPIVSRISSKLCVRISSFAFFFMVFHISTHSKRSREFCSLSFLLHQSSCRRWYFFYLATSLKWLWTLQLSWTLRLVCVTCPNIFYIWSYNIHLRQNRSNHPPSQTLAQFGSLWWCVHDWFSSYISSRIQTASVHSFISVPA